MKSIFARSIAALVYVSAIAATGFGLINSSDATASEAASMSDANAKVDTATAEPMIVNIIEVDSVVDGNPRWSGNDCRRDICPSSCVQVCGHSQEDDLRSCLDDCVQTKRSCAATCEQEHQKEGKDFCCGNWSTGEPG